VGAKKSAQGWKKKNWAFQKVWGKKKAKSRKWGLGRNTRESTDESSEIAKVSGKKKTNPMVVSGGRIPI